MKKLTVKDKGRIRELLYDGFVLAIKDDKFAGGGFERWTFDRQTCKCRSCAAFWADRKRKIRNYNLNRATKVLWHHRNSLYIYTKELNENKRRLIRDCIEDQRKGY